MSCCLSGELSNKIFCNEFALLPNGSNNEPLTRSVVAPAALTPAELPAPSVAINKSIKGCYNPASAVFSLVLEPPKTN